MSSLVASSHRRLKVAAISTAFAVGLAFVIFAVWLVRTGGPGDRATFEELSARANRVALPTGTLPYLAGNTDQRANFCIGQACPALRRAYVVPAPVGQEAAFVADLLKSTGLIVTGQAEPDCFTGRLMRCSAESRLPELQASVSLVPITRALNTAIPIPESPAPPGTNWAYLYIDLQAW